MSPAPRSGLRALLALVLALGLSAVAQAAPPDLLDIPLDDEGATAYVWIAGGCLGCSVAEADAVLTKDFDRGARLALPAATGAAAGVRVDLAASRAAGSRVGFVVRVHNGGDAALDALRLTMWTDGAFGPSADLAGPRAFDVQAVSGGRYFVSFRSAVSTAALAVEMSSAADAAFDLEVLTSASSPRPTSRRTRPSAPRGPGARSAPRPDIRSRSTPGRGSGS